MTAPVVLTATRTFAQADFDLFARISGDDNPIHVDTAFAARSRFERPVAHGMLLYAVLHGLVARAGLAGRPVEQTLVFPNPTFAGDPVRFEATCTGTAGHVTFNHVVTRLSDGAVVCSGAARYLPPEVAP